MKKFILSVLGYTVVTMALAMPWHFVFFKELYESLGIYNRVEPIIPLGLLSMLIQGFIMAYLHPRFFKGGSHVKEGVKFSLLMGVFLYSVSTLANAAKINVEPMSTWLGVQAVFHLLQFTLSGAVIGFVHSKN